MEFYEAVKKRRSYRDDFEDKDVSIGTLKKIAQTGIDAPSAKNLQTVGIVIVTDKKLINNIADIVDKDYLKTSKAIFALFTNSQKEYHIEDCAAASENILLACTSEGLASCWIDGALRRDKKSEKISKLLNIPEHLITKIILPVGFPLKEIDSPLKRKFSERVFFNKYQN